jgi:S-adenosylmethionine-dependent methyltransferase
MSDVFSERLAAWRSYTRTPWGRIRYAVVAETLRREATRLGPGLRVLDVGGGDGMDALPLASAGHHVTILDQSRAWLDEAVRRAAAADVSASVAVVEGDLAAAPDLGTFDLVLCHFVLQYRPAGLDDLVTLASYVGPGGCLSLMVPNPAAMVLRQLVTQGPAAALVELDAGSQHAVLFDHAVRKVPSAELEEGLASVGLPVVRRYGARTANDLLTDDDLKNDPAYFDDLLRLELALCDQEPYVRVAGMYQLIATRP